MKLKVKQTYFDKVEQIYVLKDSEIERENKRAEQLVCAGVAEALKPQKESEEGKVKTVTTRAKKSSTEK